MQKFGLIIALSVFASATSSWAHDHRLERDKSVTLRDGEIRVPAARQDREIYRVDGQAQFIGNIDAMIAASEDYDHYVEMKMPYIEKSFVVDRTSPDLFYVFNQAVMSAIHTRHYLEIRTYRKLNAENGAGHTWQLTPKRPSWPESEASSFSQLDGSVYFEILPTPQPLPPGLQRVYVRYFMSVNPNVPLPDWAISDLVSKYVAQGVRQVLENLGKAGQKNSSSNCTTYYNC